MLIRRLIDRDSFEVYRKNLTFRKWFTLTNFPIRTSIAHCQACRRVMLVSWTCRRLWGPFFSWNTILPISRWKRQWIKCPATVEEIQHRRQTGRVQVYPQASLPLRCVVNGNNQLQLSRKTCCVKMPYTVILLWIDYGIISSRRNFPSDQMRKGFGWNGISWGDFMEPDPFAASAQSIPDQPTLPNVVLPTEMTGIFEATSFPR